MAFLFKPNKISFGIKIQIPQQKSGFAGDILT